MRRKRSILCVILSALVVANFMGCKTNKEEKHKVTDEKTKNYSVSIDGDYIYYVEDDSEFLEINEFANEFINGLNSRDYKTKTFNSPDELYVKSMADNYKAIGRQEILFNAMMENELIVEVNDILINGIQLYTLNGEDAAYVQTEFISTYLNGKQEYLDDIGVKLNTKYTRGMSVSLQQEDGKWKVVNVEQTVREEVK